jgi:hypothetical protein
MVNTVPGFVQTAIVADGFSDPIILIYLATENKNIDWTRWIIILLERSPYV